MTRTVFSPFPAVLFQHFYFQIFSEVSVFKSLVVVVVVGGFCPKGFTVQTKQKAPDK